MALFKMKKPVIAKVNGVAVAGGMALVTLSHLAVASTNARFGTPEINVGAFPNMVMAGILRAIPKKAAMKLILLGEIIDAEEAFSMGLVNAVVAPDGLDDTVADLAAKLAGKSAAVLGLGLDAIRVSSDLPYPQALEYLQEMATIIRNTEDCQEGAKAFLEKRNPIWKGR
jgi:enoyl-CoA hydratase/carnithine racemase